MDIRPVQWIDEVLDIALESTPTGTSGKLQDKVKPAGDETDKSDGSSIRHH